MLVCQHCGATNEEGLAACAMCGKPLDEPILDGLSALKRLAALDNAESQAEPSPANDLSEAIPDWLELLLAKYGEEVRMLVGVGPPSPLTGAGPPATKEDSSKVTSLLERMAAETEEEPSTDRLATSVDWGKPTVDEEEEAADWLSQLEAQAAPPIPPPEEVAPDWLNDIANLRPEAEDTAGPPAGAESPVEPEAMPDWLQDLTPPVSPTPPEDVTAAPQPSEPTPPDGEIPDWLRGLGTTLPETKPPREEELPSATDMADLRAEISEIEEKTQPPPGETVAPPGSAEGDIPDWLSQLADASASKPEGEEPAPQIEEPWVPVEAQPPAVTGVEGPPTGDREVPDWLRELEADAGPISPQPLPESPSLEAEVETPVEPEPEPPDWLASLRSDEGTQIPAGAEYPPGEEAEEPEEPDWLAELRRSQEASTLPPGEEAIEVEQEALPDWLAELRASQADIEAPPADIEAPEEHPKGEEPELAAAAADYLRGVEEAEVPERLAELPVTEPPPGQDEEVGVPAAEVEPLEAEETSALDWLAEIEEIEATQEAPEGEITTPEAEAPSLPEAEILPDWLLEEGTPKAAPPVAEEPPTAAEGAAAAEVPDWLRDLEPQEEAPTEAMETEGVLAGLPGLLPVAEEEEPEDEEESLATLRSRLALPQVPDVEGAELFSRIAAEEPTERPEGEAAPTPVPESRRARLVQTMLWALVFVVLIAAIALALVAVSARVEELLGGPTFREFFGSPLVIDPADVNTFRAQITKLPPNAVVVVSFDYSPATGGEMDPLATAIVRDLLDNQARILAVSLRPEGAAMAQRLLNRFQSEYPYGQRTLNLGYLSGQTAGVRSLAFLSTAVSFQGQEIVGDNPAWQDVGSLSDVALIVDVSDTPMTVRWWVEQIGPGTLANRAIVAAVSTAADPTVRPYYNQLDPKTGQLHGLISGVTDAAAYESRLRRSDRATRSLAAQSVAHLGLVVASLGGTLVGFRTQAIKQSEDSEIGKPESG